MREFRDEGRQQPPVSAHTFMWSGGNQNAVVVKDGSSMAFGFLVTPIASSIPHGQTKDESAGSRRLPLSRHVREPPEKPLPARKFAAGLNEQVEREQPVRWGGTEAVSRSAATKAEWPGVADTASSHNLPSEGNRLVQTVVGHIDEIRDLITRRTNALEDRIHSLEARSRSVRAPPDGGLRRGPGTSASGRDAVSSAETQTGPRFQDEPPRGTPSLNALIRTIIAFASVALASQPTRSQRETILTLATSLRDIHPAVEWLYQWCIRMMDEDAAQDTAKAAPSRDMNQLTRILAPDASSRHARGRSATAERRAPLGGCCLHGDHSMYGAEEPADRYWFTQLHPPRPNRRRMMFPGYVYNTYYSGDPWGTRTAYPTRPLRERATLRCPCGLAYLDPCTHHRHTVAQYTNFTAPPRRRMYGKPEDVRIWDLDSLEEQGLGNSRDGLVSLDGQTDARQDAKQQLTGTVKHHDINRLMDFLEATGRDLQSRQRVLERSPSRYTKDITLAPRRQPSGPAYTQNAPLNIKLVHVITSTLPVERHLTYWCLLKLHYPNKPLKSVRLGPLYFERVSQRDATTPEGQLKASLCQAIWIKYSADTRFSVGLLRAAGADDRDSVLDSQEIGETESISVDDPETRRPSVWPIHSASRQRDTRNAPVIAYVGLWIDGEALKEEKQFSAADLYMAQKAALKRVKGDAEVHRVNTWGSPLTLPEQFMAAGGNYEKLMAGRPSLAENKLPAARTPAPREASPPSPTSFESLEGKKLLFRSPLQQDHQQQPILQQQAPPISLPPFQTAPEYRKVAPKSASTLESFDGGDATERQDTRPLLTQLPPKTGSPLKSPPYIIRKHDAIPGPLSDTVVAEPLAPVPTPAAASKKTALGALEKTTIPAKEKPASLVPPKRTSGGQVDPVGPRQPTSTAAVQPQSPEKVSPELPKPLKHTTFGASKPAGPAAIKPAAPAVTKPATPVAAKPAPLAVAKSAAPALLDSATRAVAKPGTPVILKPATPVSTKLPSGSSAQPASAAPVKPASAAAVKPAVAAPLKRTASNVPEVLKVAAQKSTVDAKPKKAFDKSTALDVSAKGRQDKHVLNKARTKASEGAAPRTLSKKPSEGSGSSKLATVVEKVKHVGSTDSPEALVKVKGGVALRTSNGTVESKASFTKDPTLVKPEGMSDKSSASPSPTSQLRATNPNVARVLQQTSIKTGKKEASTQIHSKAQPKEKSGPINLKSATSHSGPLLTKTPVSKSGSNQSSALAPGVPASKKTSAKTLGGKSSPMKHEEPGTSATSKGSDETSYKSAKVHNKAKSIKSTKKPAPPKPSGKKRP